MGPIPGSCVDEDWGLEELIPDGRGFAFAGLVIVDDVLGVVRVEERRGAVGARSELDLGIVLLLVVELFADFDASLVLLGVVGELGVPDKEVLLRWSDCGVLGPLNRGV